VLRTLVTGASSGIGRAVTLALAARGDCVVATGRDETRLSDLRTGHPEAIRTIAADLRVASERELMCDRAWNAFGGLDALVQCAGVVRYRPFLEVTDDDMMVQWETNLIAPFLVGQAVARRWINEARTGIIVNVASTLAQRPAENTSAYAASKAGLVALTKTMALELGPHGIRANAVLPGIIDTSMVAGRALNGLAKLHLLGRIGRPEEVAQAILYLLDAPFVTGTALAVDGGILLANPGIPA